MPFEEGSFAEVTATYNCAKHVYRNDPNICKDWDEFMKAYPEDDDVLKYILRFDWIFRLSISMSMLNSKLLMVTYCTGTKINRLFYLKMKGFPTFLCLGNCSDVMIWLMPP